MRVEFQLLNVVLEDHYPEGYASEVESEELVLAPEDVKSERIEKPTFGCVAFLFGRTKDGRSVTVYQEGVVPCLYFKCGPDDTVDLLKVELQQEVADVLRDNDTLRVRFVSMSEGYGFHPDPNESSGRQVVTYAEAAYPHLRAWRRALRVRRKAEEIKIRDNIASSNDEIHTLTSFLKDAAGALMRGNLDNVQELRDRFQKAEARISHLRDGVVPALQETLTWMGDESIWNEEHNTATSTMSRLRRAEEQFVDPTTRYLQEENLLPGKWYSVDLQVVDQQCVLADVKGRVSSGAFTALDTQEMSPYVVMNYDIETLGLNPDEHPVIQISAVFECGDDVERHIISVGGLEEGLLPDISCHMCETEAIALATFAQLVRRKDPDFIVAYNGVNFDNAFMYRRAQLVKAKTFFHMSRFPLKHNRLRETRLSSSGMGDNHLYYFDLPGRGTFDWYVKLKRDLPSEPRYSLNHFAKTICNDQKEDMHYSEIPALQSGTNADRARLASYCVHDSMLLARLNRARNMVVEILQFCKVFGIVPEWVYFRGQQVRVFSQLLRRMRSSRESVPMLMNIPDEGICGSDTIGKYKGATVNDPKPGFYTKPVMVADWASLYPSVMSACNICYTTHVPSSLIETAPFASLLSDGRIREFDVGDGHKTYFSQCDKGILPELLEHLSSERSNAKRSMKAAELAAKAAETAEAAAHHQLLASVYDKLQLAFKVASNSVYGFTGAIRSNKWANLDISLTVTAMGRLCMDILKDILPKRFPGFVLIYGDTDSIFFSIEGVTTVETAGRMGQEVSDYVTAHFADVLQLRKMRLEFEKVYDPFLCTTSKKRYSGKKYEPNGQGVMVCKGTESKGMETERRDTLPFVKDVMRDMLTELMEHKDASRMLALFVERMQAIIRDEVPFEKYVMKKTLSTKVQHKTDTIVQAKVNADRRNREEGSQAAVNEQVEYVIVNGHRKENTTQLAQDPDYARASGMQINRLWYFEHAIRKPIERMLAVFSLPVKEVLDDIARSLDAQRIHTDDSIRNVMSNSSSSSSSSRAFIAPHAPLPPNRKKRRTTF